MLTDHSPLRRWLEASMCAAGPMVGLLSTCQKSIQSSLFHCILASFPPTVMRWATFVARVVAAFPVCFVVLAAACVALSGLFCSGLLPKRLPCHKVV